MVCLAVMLKMVESCSDNGTKSILVSHGSQKEACSSYKRKVSFEDLTSTSISKLKKSDQKFSNFEESGCGSEDYFNCNIESSYRCYADKLFLSMLETLEDNVMCHCIIQQEKIDSYARKVICSIFKESYKDMPLILHKRKRYASIELFADKLVNDALTPVVNALKNGLICYCETLSVDITASAVNHACQRMQLEKTADTYAEKLSLRVFRDFFIHIITDANRIAYHLLGSYEAVSKNQLRTFAENVMENIMNDLFSKKHQEHENEVDVYAELLADDIVTSAVEEKNTSQSYESSTVSVATAERYASQMVQMFFTDVPILTINSRRASTRSTASGNLFFRRDSCDDTSEAITPKSAAGECQWKRGIYHFADQLLYSLTALEKEDDGSDTISELGDKVVYRRERRWGSCPHIHQKPFAISKELAAWRRRKSETVVLVRNNLLTYAEDLANDIISSVIPLSRTFF